MLQQVAETTYREAWNEYCLDNMQTWDDIPSIIFQLDGASTHIFIIWYKS
jgi:hypothetical protein